MNKLCWFVCCVCVICFLCLVVTHAVRFVLMRLKIGYVKNRQSVSCSSKNRLGPDEWTKALQRKLPVNTKQHSICSNEKPHTYAKCKQRARFFFSLEKFLVARNTLDTYSYRRECLISFVYAIYWILSRKFNFIP